MCGIAGIIGENADEALLDKMLFVQKHRGPDFTGKYVDKGAVLGHNRLSIIDLSANANQPFFSKDKRYVLVYNGEIYNYLEIKEELKQTYDFETVSDTEVLLAAYLNWGSACLSRLNGMFSFAVWDTEKQSLFAARDRFGVKPFYYTQRDNSFYFASEIKTLFAADIPQMPNKKVWATYFAYGSYGQPEESFWEGIEQLPGGYSLLYKGKKIKVQKWYYFEEEVKKHQAKLPFEEVKETYRKLLENSIKLRFRADVPIGFNVSGGLDSSLLLSLVNRVENVKNISAFTFYTGDENYDELLWVEDLIQHTQNPLHKVRLDSDEVKALSPEMALSQDEPFGGVPTMAYAKIFREARKNGIKVLLDGQGMDEQWAGYDYYLQKSGNEIQGVNKSPLRPEVLAPSFLGLAEKPDYPKLFDDDVLNLQYRDLFYTKIPRVLRFNDRVSMAASTELREPFLDYRLVEFAFAQPLEYKIKEGVQKYLLRSLVSEYLSENIRLAPKRPLQTPQREWLAKDLKNWVRTEIDKIEGHEWFKEGELQKHLKAYFDGDRDSSFHIWQWINFALLINKKKKL